MKTSFTILLMAIASALLAAEPQNIPLEKLGTDFRLIGKLHQPLGKVFVIEGVVVEGPFKGYEGGFNLRVQQIRGSATQEDIQIVIRPFFYKWGDEAIVGGDALPNLKIGETYEMEGYETGGYKGVPGEVFDRGAVVVQTTEHYFREEFVVTKAKRIQPIQYAPYMFEGRKALLMGIARSENGHALMTNEDWSVVVTNNPWAKDIEGKQIETWGLYNSDAERKVFTLRDGNWRLVRLQDQVSRRVELRGCARSLNGVWWFHYRGVDLYVDGMENLPGWTSENHWRPMVIRGRLEKAMLPRLDQVSLKANRDLKEYFIVRDAEWTPLSDLLGPERAYAEPE